jgi:hypothetical protein
MYSSITITNSINLENKKINYKFSLIFDKINWKTIVALKINDDEYLVYFSGDFFIEVLSKVSVLLQLPYDIEKKVYNGPEIKIKAYDTYSTVLWTNVTNTNNDTNISEPFKIPGLYVNDQQQKIYDDTVLYLINLSRKIFNEKINAKK